ncbi:MAG: response regulator [Methylibium sp.]|nr:response regulator [Methylibium sp.]
MSALARLRPTSLAQRFALAAAGLAAAALLLITLASWRLISSEHDEAVRQLAATERQYRAEAVGDDLNALASRMTEMAESTILATGLVDSAGRETYLAPFLNGIRQISGVPVQVLFTDFEGQEIASNGVAQFAEAELQWLRVELAEGRAGATVFKSAQDAGTLVALAPMHYARTTSPEGALFYKVSLADLRLGDAMTLEWGPRAADAIDDAGAATVPVPPVFEPLHFRVRGGHDASATLAELAPGYLRIALIASILFGTVVLVGAKLARLMTRDLEQLRVFANRFVGSGLGGERAPVGGSLEVSSLAHSINTMLDRLGEQHTTLSAEREKLTGLTDALRLADRRKDDFLAMLAHELRNPLAPITTGAELLKRVPGSDPRLLRTTAIIERQARHMREILDDLLDVSRVTRGLVTLELAPLQLADVVRMAVEQVRPLVEQHGHTLQVDVPPGVLQVRGDRARLIQVLSNLLTNAAKYTPEGGQITLLVQPDAEVARIVVQDNGAGIAAELMPEIFDLFSQGSRTVERAQGGLGLGLALVKHLVGLHGGTIDAASDGAGCGATFTVCLPRDEQPGAAQPAEAVAAQPPAQRRLRLMLVDDNVDAVQSMAALLEIEGHEVQVAHDGSTALAQLGNAPIDAFLLDIGLPGMDGFELARQLRERPQSRSALLIAVTGYGQAADKARSVSAGFDQHLVKPVDLAVLRTALAPLSAP